MVKKFFWFFLPVMILMCLAGGGAYYSLVVLHPGEEIRPENIDQILGKESPVFYDDGTTRLGVFFDQAHRQYVPYDQIPVNFINALVASEDNRFFYHFGFDVVGILRAVVKNIQAGRVVQGGSTLTQQTAKNLFKREGRSFRAKLKEFLFALRLEYHYPKEKIFEFYANQFFVSGNGHGLGVAARYYFDKKPQELSMLECAYIAGSVKRPNAYNPFLRQDNESITRALAEGKTRVNYVLTKMLGLGMISDYQYTLAKDGEIVFKKGTVGYSLDYVMDMVKDAVSSTEVLEALEKHDITNVSTSGVRIITTVNKNLQEQALYALRHDLSRLDVRLRGYERDEVQAELAALTYKGDTLVKDRAFLAGVIKTVTTVGGSPEVEVFFSQNNGSGIIDKDGLGRIVTARMRWLKNPWTDTKSSDYIDFLKQLQPGDRIWVSVREIGMDGRILLDMEKFSQVNGGALVLKNGVIKAMAGGIENRFYNRAIYARRTMGSSLKPFVFAAAMQLGWNAADPLKNTRDVFVFHNQAYFPRPDHDSPYDEVSMSWAGVHSENIAAVWLLAHLCDKLSFAQFKEVAAKVDLTPRIIEGVEEPYSRYMSRIRDTYGIVVNLDMLRQAAFKRAILDIETDLMFEGRGKEYNVLKEMHYGLNFKRFYNQIEADLDEEDKKLSTGEKNELALRRQVLANSFLSLEALHDEFSEYMDDVSPKARVSSPAASFQAGGTVYRPQRRAGQADLLYDQGLNRYCFTRSSNRTVTMRPVDPNKLQAFMASRTESEREAFWQEVSLACMVSVGSFDLLKNQIDLDMEALKGQLPYSLEVLATVDDFRILVGLRYLIALARELGVSSDLQPILSFPLGSNVMTLFETLRIYEAMVTGDVTVGSETNDENRDLVAIIDRIESDEGEILYQPERQTKKVFAPETTIALGHILENTIKYGTGRYADKNIKLIRTDDLDTEDNLKDLGLSIPVLGKTGTANRYTNASFFGYLPGLSPSNNSLVIDNGYAVGVYVGFDDNKEMRKGATKITGSAGALPIWTEIVNGIVKEEGYAQHLDQADLSFYGLSLELPDSGQKNVAVDADDGGLVPRIARSLAGGERYQPSIMTFGDFSAEGSFKPTRHFYPFWNTAPSTNPGGN